MKRNYTLEYFLAAIVCQTQMNASYDFNSDKVLVCF